MLDKSCHYSLRVPRQRRYKSEKKIKPTLAIVEYNSRLRNGLEFQLTLSASTTKHICLLSGGLEDRFTSSALITKQRCGFRLIPKGYLISSTPILNQCCCLRNSLETQPVSTNSISFEIYSDIFDFTLSSIELLKIVDSLQREHCCYTGIKDLILAKRNL